MNEPNPYSIFSFLATIGLAGLAMFRLGVIFSGAHMRKARP
jgi:hypothetical protein